MGTIDIGLMNNDNYEKGLVAPITDITKIDKMAKILRKMKEGEINYLLFGIGINTGL